MTRHTFVLGTCVLLMMGLMGTSAPVAAGQQDRDPAAAQISVYMLAAQIRSMAGHRVEVFGARVARVVSSRVFILEHDGPQIGSTRHRLAVLLERGEAIAPDGAAVIVSGIARTDLGVYLSPAVPPFTARELQAVSGLAAVVASDVRVPGGITLMQPPTPAP